MLPWIFTFARLPLAAGFACVVAAVAGGATGGFGFALAIALVLLGDLTDMLDGWAARRYGLVSELGGLADPLSDSLSRLTMFFAAALAGWVWIGVPLVMAGRDILVAYVRIVLARTGGKTSARVSGKVKAIVQAAGLFGVVIVAAVAHGQGPSAAVQQWRFGLAAAVIAATGWSLIDYLRGGMPSVRELARSTPPAGAAAGRSAREP